MNQPHKHKDTIIAWANGAEIQYKTLSKEKNNEWEDIWAPLWSENTEYRIKPEPQESVHTFRIGVAAYGAENIYTITADIDCASRVSSKGILYSLFLMIPVSSFVVTL